MLLFICSIDSNLDIFCYTYIFIYKNYDVDKIFYSFNNDLDKINLKCKYLLQ